MTMPSDAPRRLTRRLRDSSGQSLVEAAIITPLLLLVTFAIIDFGTMFYVSLSLEHGVAEAARFGITGNTIPGMTRQESVVAVLERAMPTLRIDESNVAFSHLVDGAWVQGIGGPGEIGKLSLTYAHDVLVLRPLFPSGRITMRVESSMKNEDRFQ
ncbi:MAG: pilus assembly protein [Acidobacteria bacterium]|nr:pilus assembly protein [Acidobacteriota bacterium]